MGFSTEESLVEKQGWGLNVIHIIQHFMHYFKYRALFVLCSSFVTA